VKQKHPSPESSADIRENLRRRREMLNRVKKDLARVGKLQEEFLGANEKKRPRKDQS
jgi:hypothetical protein